MLQDFTSLKDIPQPSKIEMISGPVSYSRFKIFNNNIQLIEIEIFGDAHYSEKNNCTEQGESCIYVTHEGNIHHNNQENTINCVDISTYLGYAILDAHVNKQYTDIYTESIQQESGRSYNIPINDPLLNSGYIIKTHMFLQPCGTSVNRHPLCKDIIDSHSSKVSPNNERNWARVHSGDIRSETIGRKLSNTLVGALKLKEMSKEETQLRTSEMLNYILENKSKLIRAFIEPDLGASISEVFLPFYDMMYPNKSRHIQEQYIKRYYPVIYIIMREFGDITNNDEYKNIFKRQESGTLLLKRVTEQGKPILIHRVGKTYSKIMNMKNKYKEYELPYIMILAYEKFVLDIESDVSTSIKKLITMIDSVSLNKPIAPNTHLSMVNVSKMLFSKLFSPLYDIYTIGRMISYNENERIIYFAGEAHSKKLRTYITHYLQPQLEKINAQYITDDIHYSIINDIDIPYESKTKNRCMRMFI